jgi:CRISPR-associated endonuclease/helicase Cas3
LLSLPLLLVTTEAFLAYIYLIKFMKPQFAAHTPNEINQWHPLEAHLKKVANRAKYFAAKFSADEIGYYAGLWHDLGKYNLAFQTYLEQCNIASQTGESKSQNRVPHAKYGAKLAAEKFHPLAPLIYGHHGGLPQRSHMENRISEVDSAIYQNILHAAEVDSICLEISAKASQQLMAIAQNQHSYELLLRILFSCLVDADYLDTETHFDPEAATRRGSGLSVQALHQTLEAAQIELLKKANNTLVNQVRSQVYQACLDAATLEPGVFRLAVPTGGGKTRSGLAFALAHAAHYDLDRVGRVLDVLLRSKS